jgi:hypothetical protein
MHPGWDKIIGANAFEYPDEYSRRMTDWGMYAKKVACRNGLKGVDAEDRH